MRQFAAPLLILPVLTAGCSALPTDSHIRSEVVTALTVRGADDLYEIRSFKVTDGRQQDDGSYVANVHYDLLLKKGVSHVPPELEMDPRRLRVTLVLAQAVARSAFSGTPIEGGTHFPVDDEVILVKRENRWVLEAM